VAGLAASAHSTLAAGNQPGAYCPLPKAGEKPQCLGEAEAEYSEFFAALGEDEIDANQLARVEQDLEPGSNKAYLALSSLAYGYLRLSQIAAAKPTTDPKIAARLERWNAVLGRAYEQRPEDDDFRAAIREAAEDIQQTAPPVQLRCVDESGATTECDSTDAVVLGLDSAANEAGIRGGLERLLERMFGSDGS